MKGHVYIVKNKAMPGIIKIGRAKNLSGRMKSLSNSSLPQNFELVFSIFSDFSVAVEREAHVSLGAYRITPDREFFSCSEELAIETIERISSKISLNTKVFQEAEESAREVLKQNPKNVFKAIRFSEKPAEIHRINVHGNADGKLVFLGELSYDEKRVDSAFQWSDEALEIGIEWSPIKAPLSSKLLCSNLCDIPILGLPGFIHDALPDGWGMLTMNKAFSMMGFTQKTPSTLFRLCMLGKQCWGALEFSPAWPNDQEINHDVEISCLARELTRFEIDPSGVFSTHLLSSASIAHGARPKIMVAINSDASTALVGQDTLPEGYRHVLIKFAGDGEELTAPVLEYSYGEAARSLGIETAPACLIEGASRVGLCLDRFDRVNGQKRHVHSLAGMLHTTHRIANSDWLMVADLLAHLKAGDGQFEQAFSRAVFNAVFCVRDDHTKNIAFLRRGSEWSLAPAFDLAYSDGPGGYHTMTYANHTKKNVALGDLQRLAEAFGVTGNRVTEMVDNAQAARGAMLTEAKAMGVPSRVLKAISKRFADIDRTLKAPAVRRNALPKL